MVEQPTFSAESQRNAVVSAANLLMVALLKLNRVIIPVLLRWMRSRRQTWIRNSSRDLARTLGRASKRPRLCVGSCCGGSYGSILVSTSTTMPNVHPDVLHAWLQAGGDFSARSLETFKMLFGDAPKADSFLADEKSLSSSSVDIESGIVDISTPASPSQPLLATQPKPPTPTPATAATTSSVLTQAPAPVTEDVYFRLKVLEEERHRGSTMIPIAYTTVMAVYFTLLTIFLYAFSIIGLVLWNFKFQTWEAVIFSFTLIATAIISESETLMQVKKKSGMKSVFSDAKQGSVIPGDDSGAAPADGSVVVSLPGPNPDTEKPTTLAEVPNKVKQSKKPDNVDTPLPQTSAIPNIFIHDDEFSDGD